MNRSDLTMGPLLFNWKPEKWRDFYLRVADECCVDTVYLGEVVCSKRMPFVQPHFPEVLDRLQSSGKKVVFSSLAEVMTHRERKLTASLCETGDVPVEANDASALYHLRGGPHRVGLFVNTYNEATLALLAARGATHFTLPPELPGSNLAVLAQEAGTLGVTLETLVFGRIPLALSARCYHARAHGRVKDDCGMVCEKDPDGLELRTLSDTPFLAVNGIQTLSHACLNLAREIPAMQKSGISAFRLSPHDCNMVEVAGLYRQVLDGALDPAEATARLAECIRVSDRNSDGGPLSWCNGFYHHQPGYEWIEARH